MKNKITLLTFALVLLGLTIKSQGNFVWAKSLGGSNNDVGYSIAVDASGNVYTTGSFSGTADFDPGVGVFNLTSMGYTDIFVSKIDASGAFIWAKRMGGIGADYGISIVVDATGNVYTTGGFEDTVDFDPGAAVYNYTSLGGTDIFISKLNSSGSFVWAQQIGGSSIDACFSMTIDASNNIYTTGYFKGSTDFDPGVGNSFLTAAGAFNSDVFISKIDGSGSFVWANQLGDVNLDAGYSIAVDATGNVYTTGFFRATTDLDPGAGVYSVTAVGADDIFVSKLNSSGAFVWGKQFGGTSVDHGNSIAVDATGNVYITGSFNNTVDFDPGAGVSNLTSAGAEDIFVSKLDASGIFVWAKNMGGTGNDASSSISVDAAGNIYTTGSFDWVADFDPGVAVYNFTPIAGGFSDAFISKLDASGTFVWAKQVGGSIGDQGSSIALDGSGFIYTTGQYGTTADFDPAAAISNLTSAGGNDIFVLKLDNTVSGLPEDSNSFNTLNIFPNPSSGLFHLQIDNEIKNGEIILINPFGQKVFEQKIIQGLNYINSNELADGLYTYIILSDKQKIKNGKLVVN